MKYLFLITALSLNVLNACAQDGRPDDYYITKLGDTVRGRLYSGVKFDSFKPFKGAKMKLIPDSIQSYGLYTDNPNHKKGDPYYIHQYWINVGDIFYQVMYKDSGPMSVYLINDRSRSALNVMPYMDYNNLEYYFFEMNGFIHKFLGNQFYNKAKEILADCPEVIALLDNVPNLKNANKTHAATFDDVDIIISAYNKCKRK